MNVMYNLVMGPKKVGSGDKVGYVWADTEKPDEQKTTVSLTQGEREVLTGVENKLKKPLFRTYIRAVYSARRDQWRSAHRILARSYFAHFQTVALNFIKFSTVTRPKTSYVFRKRIPYLRSRKMFRNYVARFAPLFPDRKAESSVFNTEELATIFHFPIKVTGLVLPTMSRVESKSLVHHQIYQSNNNYFLCNNIITISLFLDSLLFAMKESVLVLSETIDVGIFIRLEKLVWESPI